MNDSKNYSWRRKSRNQNFENYLQSSRVDEGHTQFSNRLNFHKMANSSEKEKQNFCFEPDRNVHIRSFCEGRESETETEPFHSLYEQRTFANRQNQPRGQRNHRRSNRGYSRGRRNNFSKPHSRSSDTESVSSSDSHSQFPNSNANYNISNRSPIYSHSVSEPSQPFSENTFPESVSNSQFSNSNVNFSFSNRIPVYSHSVSEPSRIPSENSPKPISTEFRSKDFGSRNTELANFDNCLTNTQCDLNKMPNLNAMSSRGMLNEYKNMLKQINPSQIIIETRQQVEEFAREPTVLNLKKIEELASQNHCSMLKLHLKNLVQQQAQFESYIAKVKVHLSSLFSSDVPELLDNIEKIEKDVKRECNIFKRSLPAYAYKEDILKCIRDNQVTIINSDANYFLNILLPIFVKSEFPDHYLVCSEICQILAENLQQNVFQLVHDKIRADEMEEIKFRNEMNFVTIEEMLGLFSDDYTFKDNKTFTILNLSLKRSLNQDIVLSFLRDILLEDKDSKIVLMVTFNDSVYKYEKYFSSKMKVGLLTLPSLILPVKTVWKNSALQPIDDYVNEATKTILAIHTLNDPGDILAFLPTSTDTKSASTAINKKLSDLQFDDLRCEIINENSSQKRCLELFNKKPHNKRTVFLTTDCAEMLVIPSVSYIVDCGLRKEYIFDGDKKIDVLSTTFISHNKSKLRKSLAGSFSAGICYRLYSKEDYTEMPSNEYPEILTINPFNSMIKIFQHRPDIATTVEFVESLPENTKESALDLLKKYNAIKDNILTDLGKNIVKLPFPAKYSKLILLGIHWGLAYEAVVLVAFFSVKGRVFQFCNDADRQREIDAAKLNLVQQDSDTLSYLYIYKMWLDSDCSEAWCEKHYMNYITLKNIHAKVNEICQIVGESLKENINQEFSNTGKNSVSSLLEMLFDCFLENLCVFTGHYRSGYRVLSSHCIAFLHPSSIVCQMENLPQFIIFDHMICTNREFLMSITAIPPDFITKAMVDQQIDFDFSDMYEKSLVHKVIEPVGERLIKQVLLGKKGKKLKAIEAHIKSLLSTDSLVIEPVVEKGQVLVFALKNQVDEALKLVDDVLKRQFEDLVNLEQVHVLDMKRGQITIPIEVKWLRGAQIAAVKIGKSSQDVADITSEFDTEENPPGLQPCIIQQSINVTWVRRPCNGNGFVTFRREDFAQARKLTMKNFAVFDSSIFVQLSRYEENQLHITNIPKEVKSSDLEAVFSNLLPNIKPVKIELKYASPFETSETELQEIKSIIEEICHKYTKLSNFEVVIPFPKSTATIMKAFINVNDKEDIEFAVENLLKCKIGNARLICKPVYRSIIKCGLKICEALKPRFQETLTELQNKLKEKFVQDELFEFVINQASEDLAIIKMLSNKKEILQMLQRVINQLIEGEVLDRSINFRINKIFCHGGHLWLRNLEKTSKVHIIEDYNNKTLRVYGSKQSCSNCKQRILQFLEDSANEAVAVIPLSGQRKLLKEIIKKYGVNLEKFIEDCELQSAVLDIKSCSISLIGSQDSLEMSEDLLKELAARLHSNDSSEIISSAEKCPLCLCSAFNLTFRLELCGHLYCSECIEGLVNQAEFPLRCCAEDCCHDIILEDVCKALADDPEKIKILLEKSLKYYIEKHVDDVIYCPAPDCSMFFFKKEITDEKHNCPLCQNDICIKCNVVYHQGLSCDMYQGSKNDPDYSFKVWQKTTAECKRCPKCNVAIERNGGCEHMTCLTCKSHFCWVCVREFPDAAAVYRHIPFCDQYPRQQLN